MQTTLLKPEEVAKRLGVGRTTIYQLLARGEIPTVRIGTSVRVSEQSLERFVEARTVGESS